MFFNVALGLGENDHVTLVADTFKVGEGNGVCHATVKHLLSFQLHHLRDQWHRGRRTDPVVGQGCGLLEFLIHRTACLHIGADSIKRHRVLIIGLIVEDIILCGNDMVAEFGIIEIA